MLGIKVHGMENHPDPNAVYTAFGQALHKLPSPVMEWLQDHGKNLRIRVTPDGLIHAPGLGPNGVGGYYSGGRVVVGVAGEKSMWNRHEFTTPKGDLVSQRTLSVGIIQDVTLHEFAHWIDDRSDKTFMSISKKHPELFGTKGQTAPHDARRWERFASSMASYLGDKRYRDMLDPNVVKFFDKFIGPQLSYDTTASRKGTRSMAIVKRVAAIKVFHEQGWLHGTPDDVERRLRSLETQL